MNYIHTQMNEIKIDLKEDNDSHESHKFLKTLIKKEYKSKVSESKILKEIDELEKQYTLNFKNKFKTQFKSIVVDSTFYVEYLKNQPEQFLMWDISNRDILRQITYRTHERTIFKNYKYGLSGYSSIE